MTAGVEINPEPNPKVCILAYDNLCLFEFSQAVEVFAKKRENVENWYNTSIIAAEPGEIRSEGGVVVTAPYDLSYIIDASLIIIPGWRKPNAPISAELKQALQKANENGARIASICSGAFVLAQAGLLSGKMVTTHWQYSTVFKELHPDVILNTDILYNYDDNILTSAGAAAGLDLCLHIVRSDYGAEIANMVARKLVVPAHRDGSQSQYISRPIELAYKSNIANLLDIVRENLDKDWNIDKLAKTANISARTLQRRFKNATGQSPHNWLTYERIELAKEILETTDLNIQEIADITGLRTPETMRHHFNRMVGISPTRYRNQFKQSSGKNDKP